MHAAALAGCCHPPEDVRIELAVVFARRRVPHGNGGTYVVPHGPRTPPMDAEAVPRLIDARPFVLGKRG